MSQPRREKKDELGVLAKWALVLGLLLYGLVSLLMWPIRRVARLLPGRRQRLVDETSASSRKAIQSGRQLLRVLSENDPDLGAKFDAKADELERELEQLVAGLGWPEDMKSEHPWSVAIDLLEKAKLVGGIDWKSDPGSLKKEIAPLFRRCAIKFDWSFLKELENAGYGDNLSNENLLPLVARKVAEGGHILAQIADGSDNYLFAVCTPEQFSRIDSLAEGDYAIRQFYVDESGA
jgi:hypothetical protein